MNSIADALRAAGIHPSHCARKHRYDSRERAETIGQRCTRQRQWILHAYHCEKCGGWHLTKQPQIKGGK